MTRNKLSFLFTVMFLVSCSTSNQSPIDTSTRISALASTAIGTVAPPTLTSIPASTVTVTPLPSWTPLPTLVDEDSFLDFISFTKNSCKFPCWAGIHPSETDWDKALVALRPMESMAKFETYIGVEGLFGKENVVTWYLSGNEFTVNGDIGAIVANRNRVNLIHINVVGSSKPSADHPSESFRLPQSLNLQSVLKEYGVPAMVFLYTFIHDEPGPLPFSVLLVYPENQFYIIYQRNAKLSGSTVAACGPEFYLELGVVDNKDKLLSADTIAHNPETTDIGIENWKPVQQVLSLSPEKFHAIYSASMTECMSFSSDLWRP